MTSFRSWCRGVAKSIACGALIALSCSLAAPGQTQPKGLEQYRSSEWGRDRGLAAGRIEALAQSPDGYLWVGTVDGLFRFDGFRFVPILTEKKQPLRRVLGLTVDRQDVLWVRTADLRVRRVNVDSVSNPIAFQNRPLGIMSMSAAPTGGIYATVVDKSVVRLTRDRVEALPIHSKAILIANSVATDGQLWIGTDRGLLSWANGALKVQTGVGVDKETNCLLAVEDGHVWVGTDRGLAYWDGHQLTPKLFENLDMQHLQVLSLMEDSNKNLWIGTSMGLVRYSSSGAQWISKRAEGEEAAVTALIQDREGNVWFGSGSSLDRLESAAIVPIRPGYPASGKPLGPIYVDHVGRTWFADLQQGLYWMQDGVVHAVSTDGLAKDEIYSIDGAGDYIWIGRRWHGLTRLHIALDTIESKTWTTQNGLAQNSVYVVRTAPDGAVWAGTLTAGVSRLKDGHFIQYSEANGLPSNAVSAIETGADGQVWIGTSSGVCRIGGGRCVPLSATQDLQGAELYSLLHDPLNGLWVGTSKGLSIYTKKGKRDISIQSGTQPAILGLGSDRNGRLWMVSDHSVMSATSTQLLASQYSSVRSYGKEDGLQLTESRRRSRSVVTDARGQVWMSTANELAVTGNEPGPLPIAIPHVEEVVADGVDLNRDKLSVPPGARRLVFTFTGINLQDPSKVRFRYRLDDFDKSWSEVTAERQATYTNLAPGKYTFRLTSFNLSDSSNAKETAVQIVVKPMIWQRWSIRYLFLAVLGILAVATYRARTRILLAQANALAEERLRERTRIAREVHDTLLQGFISSLMHLHVVDKQIASNSPLKSKFTFVLDGMERVIEEARLAVVGLRAPKSGHQGLESCIREFFLEIGDISEAALTLESTGTPRTLKREAFEDLCAISKEAILNAVRHADAKGVQVTIDWGWRGMKLEVSDNGRGMDTHTLANGVPQHWGLKSIRERSKQLKAKLTIRSHVGLGTAIRLGIPAKSAYQKFSKTVSTHSSSAD
ncbi:sensor histidine kinase [soil metagenome]